MKRIIILRNEVPLFSRAMVASKHFIESILELVRGNKHQIMKYEVTGADRYIAYDMTDRVGEKEKMNYHTELGLELVKVHDTCEKYIDKFIDEYGYLELLPDYVLSETYQQRKMNEKRLQKREVIQIEVSIDEGKRLAKAFMFGDEQFRKVICSCWAGQADIIEINPESGEVTAKKQWDEGQAEKFYLATVEDCENCKEFSQRMMDILGRSTCDLIFDFMRVT